MSFFTPSAYYGEAASLLRNDCERNGIESEIVERPDLESGSWADGCRSKVPFYFEMHHKFRRPILWLDVDSRIGTRPDFLEAGVGDMAGFLRGFRYLRDFDPALAPRFFAPFALYFDYNPRVTAFLELMSGLEREFEGQATDDYFLQEAWQHHRQQLSVTVLRPELVGHSWPLTPPQAIYVGISGNVATFKTRVAQHGPPAMAGVRRRAVLADEAERMLEEGDNDGGVALFQRALRAAPDDREALRAARLIRRAAGLEPACSMLSLFEKQHSERALQAVFRAESMLLAGDAQGSRAAADRLVGSVNVEDRRWARRWWVRADLDVRATGLEADQRVPVYWPEESWVDDFSDLLTLYLIEVLSGRPPKVVSAGRAAVYCGVDAANAARHCVVWCAGGSDASAAMSAAPTIRMARGPLTRQWLQSAGIECPGIYGHLAWVLPRVYRPSFARRRHAVGIAAVDALSISGSDKFHVALRCRRIADVERVIDELCSCDLVLTDNLDVLAICHTYGVPVRWRTDSVEQRADSTPFALRDYLLALNGVDANEIVVHREAVPRTARKGDEAAWLPDATRVDAVLAAAPFDVRIAPAASPGSG